MGPFGVDEELAVDGVGDPSLQAAQCFEPGLAGGQLAPVVFSHDNNNAKFNQAHLYLINPDGTGLTQITNHTPQHLPGLGTGRVAGMQAGVEFLIVWNRLNPKAEGRLTGPPLDCNGECHQCGYHVHSGWEDLTEKQLDQYDAADKQPR
ncbi:hypothetical protein [Nocardioides immobilis]|uniref:hypothetical protein n=1 Tax=Nocardioides immobilis TaxID=2049295 RepID=UPI0015F8CB47|nr:hypothetical protein [Nocardioides immobilis]